uniref:Disintegrin domain-containing protein n=1 Tax=Pundamilia nyererei TaxID=303518 RepID=A0A3B4GHE8_9CICH
SCFLFDQLSLSFKNPINDEGHTRYFGLFSFLMMCCCALIGQECEDPCCNASTCKLVPGAQCSSDGICCQDCKVRLTSMPTNIKTMFPYCTGSSPYCPPNVFLQNGEPYTQNKFPVVGN